MYAQACRIFSFPSPCGVNIVGNILWVRGSSDRTSLEFPSPCGVNIVGNTMRRWLLGDLPDRFPSPCGVNIVGNRGVLQGGITPLRVSVPLRGKYCREYDGSVAANFILTGVSVPLRGKYCREFMMLVLHCRKTVKSVSVPLRGKYCRESTKVCRTPSIIT